MRRLLTIAACGVLVVAALVVVEAVSGTASSASRAAPALPSSVLQGPPATLASLRGRPAVVHFWASWCGPCTREAPQIATLGRSLAGRATLVGVDWSDNPANARRFLRQHGWHFPVLRDGSGQAGQAYRIVGLPTTFIVDARGRITKRITGPITEQQILSALPPAHS